MSKDEIDASEAPLIEHLIEPTRIYVKSLLPLIRAGRIHAVPQDVAPHLDQGGGKRIEEALAVQCDFVGGRGAFVARGVSDGEGHGHGQVGEDVFREVIDKGGCDVGAAAFDGHHVGPQSRQQVGDGVGDGAIGSFPPHHSLLLQLPIASVVILPSAYIKLASPYCPYLNWAKIGAQILANFC